MHLRSGTSQFPREMVWQSTFEKQHLRGTQIFSFLSPFAKDLRTVWNSMGVGHFMDETFGSVMHDIDY